MPDKGPGSPSFNQGVTDSDKGVYNPPNGGGWFGVVRDAVEGPSQEQSDYDAGHNLKK